MNPDKEIIISGLLNRINSSPYLIVIEYAGLTVQQMTELRNRLYQVGSSCTVAKNSYMKKALAEAKYPNIGDDLVGQKAFVMGSGEIVAAAKIISNFEKEFKKPQMKVGLLGQEPLTPEQLNTLAAIPPREILLAQLLGVINEPAARIARVINMKYNPEKEQN